MDLFKLLVEDNRVDKNVNNNEPLQNASKSGDFLKFRALLELKSVYEGNLDKAMVLCAEYDEPELLAELLSIRDPTFDNDSLLLNACANGTIECVRVLLNDWRVHAGNLKIIAGGNENHCLRLACESGSLPLVKLLIERADVDVADLNNAAFRIACEEGHTDIVELLLQNPDVNPCDLNHSAIQVAARNGHEDIVEMLLEDGRIDVTANDNEFLKVYYFDF
jgi:ankyrin repeat protein